MVCDADRKKTLFLVDCNVVEKQDDVAAVDSARQWISFMVTVQSLRIICL